MDDLWFEQGYADQYREPQTRQKILEAYQRRWREPSITPDTHPWLFNPLDPPAGWRYDPYYEMWIQQ
jgi:hypothetical protein